MNEKYRVSRERYAADQVSDHAGDYTEKSLSEEKVSEIRGNLRDMLSRLEAHYGTRPLLYVTKESYRSLIQGHFPAYPLWARSVYGEIDYLDSGEWTLWQYSNRRVLRGYSGRERYIDMNVFNGSKEEFSAFTAI